jgi:predicted transposase/invertase (TIGR01784 family)
MQAKYINPFTDFGFKKIFGEEASKVVLIDFLNALLPAQNKIAEISFRNSEQLGQLDFDRKAILDIYCESEKGEKFIVELQKAKQNYFIERTIYYSTFPIREQAEKGQWDYNLKAVFCIGILDFTFDDYETEPEKGEVVHTIKLKNQNGKTFYDKLTYIYLEMPNFIKAENQLTSRLDKWLYFIKNLEDFENIPQIFKEEVFTIAFEKAEIANFRKKELDSYEASLKVFRDNKNTYDYAKQTAWEDGMSSGLKEGMEKGMEKGIEKGIEKANREIAKKLKESGISIEIIQVTTGLTIEEIKKL